MNRFTAANGQFWLNDRPLFVHAGEFHYYRTPKDQWPHRLGLLKDAGLNTLATYIPWLWHQLEEGVSDFDGHSHPMRDLQGFLDLAAEMGFYIIPRPGPYIMAETINEGIPPWVFTNYPQVAFISQESKIQNLTSYNHPDFRACVQNWYKAIFSVLAPRQITRGGKIIMVQLDNEMGMAQWVRNIIDTNANTLEKFAHYLAETYAERLRERYPAEDLAAFLKEQILNPSEAHGANVVEDYRRFYRGYLRDYAAFLLAAARECGLETLPVINIHGFGNGGKTFPIGLSQLIDVMRLDGIISATDVYPLYIGDGSFHELLLVNEMTKVLDNPDQALFSIEFQSGGNHDFGSNQSSMYDLHSRLCISVGMRAINHYSFFGGENHPVLSPVRRHDWGPPVRPDGTLRSHYHRYPRLSRVINTYGEDLVNARPQTVTTIGFILDYYMTEVNNRATADAARAITHLRDRVLFDFLGKGLAVIHRPYDTIELASGDLDPSRTPHLWVMMDRQCSPEIQQKLVDYLRRGGKLALVGRMCVEDFDRSPCTILKDAVGIEPVRSDLLFTGQPWATTDIRIFDYPDVPVSFYETYSGDFDETIAALKTGEPVGFIKRVGDGTALVLGTAVPANTLEDIAIVRQMAGMLDCPPLFELSRWADVRISRGARGSFLFINNYLDDPIETTVKAAGEFLFGGSPVRLDARRGTILPLEWQVREGVTLHYATSEIMGVADNETGLMLRTDRLDFAAELTLDGYAYEGQSGRVKVEGRDGSIVLKRA